MARLSHSTVNQINRSAIDIASAELGTLLLRLQKTVLHTDNDRERRLRSSEFERARVASVRAPVPDSTPVYTDSEL